MKKTAILYARASTQEQSTKIQIQQLEKYCIENDIEVLKTFAENVSGAAEHREELEKILNSDPLADLLIIREASRLSREEDYNEAYFKLQLLLKKYSIYILADNIYLERGKTDLAKDIMMMIKLFGAADERKNIKLRTTTAVKKYKENPINVVSGNGNFGMMKAPNPNFSKGVNTRNIWVKNPDEWKTVLKVFELRSKGYSINKISQYLGLKVCIVRQIFESKVINYYMEQDHKELLFAAEDKKVELTTVKAPSKHLNKYKGKIFVENSDYYMRHQIAAKGIYFKDKLGKMTIKESIIDDCVIRTIKCMLAFFDLKKSELSKNNEIHIIELTEMKNGILEDNKNIKIEIDGLKKKFLKAKDDELLETINIEISKLKDKQNNNSNQLIMIDSELKRLNSIDYDKIGLVIDETNISDFIDKYIDKVRVYRGEHFKIIVRVYVKREFIDINWYDYKVYEIFNHRGYKLNPIHIEYEAGCVYDEKHLEETSGAGGFWSLRIPKIPENARFIKEPDPNEILDIMKKFSYPFINPYKKE